MSDQIESVSEEEIDGVSRRGVLLGLGAAAGVAAGATLFAGNASAASAHATAAASPSATPRPQAVGAPIPGLQYIAIDAQQFWPSIAAQRVYQDLTGTQPLNINDEVIAGLPLPAGSVIYQLNVGYQGKPVMRINRRLITQPNPATAPTQVFEATLTESPGGPFSSTVNLSPLVTILPDSSYTISMQYKNAGSSIYNVSIGYLPPTQSFVPFPGTTPRVYDSREGGVGKLAPNEERVIDLGVAGARSAVINVTVTQTVSAGYVAVFRADKPWPNNSSVNWSGPNSDVANGVITEVDPTGKIKIRGGANPTHVVIDRIGFLL
jgi:hypothetical protein